MSHFDHEEQRKIGTFATIITSRSQWEIVQKYVHKSNKFDAGFENSRIFEENFIWFPLLWTVYPGSLLIENLDNFIFELQQHGHIQYHKSLQTLANIPKPEEPRPKVLTMQILSAGFIVWMATISTAFVAFACENLWRYLTVTRNLKKRNIIKLGDEYCEWIEL